MPIRSVIGLGAVLLAAGPAQAAFISAVGPDPVTKATGNYRITLTDVTATSYTIAVVGLNDGNVTDPDGSGPEEAKAPADFVNLVFKDAADNPILLLPAPGGTNAGSDASGNFAGGAWIFQTPPTTSYAGLAPTATARLGAFGGNTFSGSLTLNTAPSTVHVLIGGGSQSWRTVVVIPEPAMASVALIGVGAVALRRRQR